MRTWCIPHLSQRVSLRRTQDVIAVQSEDEEEATASDGQLNQGAAHAYEHSANIDLEEDDGRGEALEFS